MTPARKPDTITVRVRLGREVRTHPAHPDGVHAPDAQTLAAIDGLDGPETVHRQGETIELPAEVADGLIKSGVVERA